MEACVRFPYPSSVSPFSRPYLLKLSPNSFHHAFTYTPSPQKSKLPSMLAAPGRQHRVGPFGIKSHPSAVSAPNPGLLALLRPHSAFHHFGFPVSIPHFDRVSSESRDKFIEWHRVRRGTYGGNAGLVTDQGASVTVVLLGWLGAKHKHLKRYVDLYVSRGIDVVTFVIPLKYVLGFDLGRRVEEQISGFSNEISWLSESENGGGQRNLIFHTFSNTGWLVYGAILDNLQGKQGLLERIKGCVFDSGPDPELNPKVWAAGFSAALLKKQGSIVTCPSWKTGVGTESESGPSSTCMQHAESSTFETLLFSLLEKFFSVFLKLPSVHRRLIKIISIPAKYQPDCPQLYLYSTADKVIPSESVEQFIADQRRIGREVRCFNFGSSPHVDHYRTFPDLYTSQLHEFLRWCLPTVKQSSNR